MQRPKAVQAAPLPAPERRTLRAHCPLQHHGVAATAQLGLVGGRGVRLWRQQRRLVQRPKQALSLTLLLLPGRGLGLAQGQLAPA